ncbi:hypothetical protein [Rhodovulum sulfidophilum]|uniref:Uncharacterized protein n=1 Tax=Rhodovulum sulfidophilum TaxID=35806 RepID=A0ABS1RVQ6_RHOSU|nr:hypothetical protein [Rhodovulum sulfidophilum]MBL3609743.1 hypothetical protein [Rhodovulum sulfidophilum]MCE8457886.1 hypothetical protein [Rhodovulum sulfidophilum]
MDSFAKRAPAKLPVNQIAAARFGLQTLILQPLALTMGQIRRQATRGPTRARPHRIWPGPV